MIDKIGNNIRPLNKKKKEEENADQSDSNQGQGQNKHHHNKDQGLKAEIEPDIRVSPERLEIVLKELNNHPYYQNKKLEFKEANQKIQVIEKESGKVVKIIGLYRLLSIHAQMHKNQDKGPKQGQILNVSC